MAKLTIPQQLVDEARLHLLRDEAEHVAFFLCNVAWTQGEPVFLAREMLIVDDKDLASHLGLCVELKLEPLLGVINTAVKERRALVEAHSHPLSDYPVFSLTDKAGFDEFVPYVVDSLAGKPYGATVWGRKSVSGLYWSSWPREGESLEITAVGSIVNRLSHPSRLSPQGKIYDRQMRALGSQLQRNLADLKVGIVGHGGIGSHVTQQLAYLGVRDFVVIDGQKVEDTDLNRLVGASRTDVRMPKVEVAARQIRMVSRQASVLTVKSDLRATEAIDALKVADVVFGCVDNDGARLILNELSIAYMVPYLDIGTEIIGRNGHLDEAGGRVNLVLPGGPCLNCMGQLDLEEARLALASREEVEQAMQQRYIAGTEEPSPSVVTLNGVVASMAVTEFLNLVAGLRPPTTFITYDMMGAGRGGDSQWAVPQRVEKAAECLECSLAGIGDAVFLERYVAASNGSFD